MRIIFFLLLTMSAFESFAIDKYCNGAPTIPHANGGGQIAITAIVPVTALVTSNASVCEYAIVLGGAEIRDDSRVYGLARIGDGSIISGKAEVFGNASLDSTNIPNVVNITDNAKVFGNARISGNSIIKGNSKVFDNVKISDKAIIQDSANVFGNASIAGNASIQGNAKIHGRAFIGGDVTAVDGANICEGRYYEGRSVLNTTICSTPQPIRLVTTQISMGPTHVCSLFVNGKVRCWGSGLYGALGYGNTTIIGDNELPIRQGFTSLGNNLVTKIASGPNFSCAVLSTGSVRCWGINNVGQLGLGNISGTNSVIGDNELPSSVAEVSVGTAVDKISVGGSHVCITSPTGDLRCWGLNTYGQLGYGNTQTIGDNEHPSTVGVVSFVDSSLLATGLNHTCSGYSNGIRCWGNNTYGQLGYGNTTIIGDNELPSSLAAYNFSPDAISQIVAGDNHNCVLLTAGAVKCWGLGTSGQLGYGNTNIIGDNELPNSVSYVSVGAPALQIAAGSNHTCVIITGGKVRCWGANSFGQLGYGNTNIIGDNELPSTVGDVNIGGTASKIYASGNSTCVLLTSGRVKCWGDNSLGQLGYGMTFPVGDNETPASVGDVYNFTSKNI